MPAFCLPPGFQIEKLDHFEDHLADYFIFQFHPPVLITDINDLIPALSHAHYVRC